MSVPDSAVRFVPDNLGQILTYNHTHQLVANVGDKIWALRKELHLLEGLMKDVAKFNLDSDYRKALVKEIKSMVDDAEDAVDTYVVHAAVQKSRSWISKTILGIDYLTKLRGGGKKIQKIRKKILQFHLERVPGAYLTLLNQALGKLGQPANSKEDPNVEEEHVVGFDGTMSEASQLLTSGSEQLEVMPIAGMLGLGKTVFVYVSKEFLRKECSSRF